MMIDAFLPEGITRLAVDSIFMMPQLGVLSQLSEEAAMQVFHRDCLIHLGTVVAPVGLADAKSKIRVTGKRPDGTEIDETTNGGEVRLVALGEGESVELTCDPTGAFDMGAGRGKQFVQSVSGGVVGLIIDARGRPFNGPKQRSDGAGSLRQWLDAVDAYPQIPGA